MAHIDETVVEHWLRRQGYSTVRGLATRAKDPKKKGRKELDLLAIHVGNRELIHTEVQSSPSPMNYLGELKSLDESVRKYIRDKFDDMRVQDMRNEWCRYQGFEVDRLRKMVVYQKLKEKREHEEKDQLEVLRDEGVEAVSFSEILRSLKSGRRLSFQFKSDVDDLATLFLTTPINEDGGDEFSGGG